MSNPKNPFLAAVKALKVTPAPTLTNPDLPACPLCKAAACAGYAFERWDDLAHVCNCDLTDTVRYQAAMQNVFRQKHALPLFLELLPERYRAYSLDTFQRAAGNAPALIAARAGVTGNFYLYGEAGAGKTHLAVAAARVLAGQGKTARFWGMASLIKALRDSNAPGAEVARPELHHWDVLVLDDIDKIKPTAYVYETFYELVEARWAANKITIFTAQTDPNEAAVMLTPEGSETAADPLASRMGAGKVEEITGKDRRAGQAG